jgi:hypothetical protein
MTVYSSTMDSSSMCLCEGCKKMIDYDRKESDSVGICLACNMCGSCGCDCDASDDESDGCSCSACADKED